MTDQIYISMFQNAHETTPIQHISLQTFYESIIDNRASGLIEAIRSEPDPNRIKELKKKLPGFTVSGTFNPRKGSGLIKHSGRICIDIDAKDNPGIRDWKGLRNTIGTWSEVEFCALSVSGKGCFAVIPIQYHSRHKDHFMALQKDFKKIGLVIDDQCSDVCRLRFITADPLAIWNQTPDVYRKFYMPSPDRAMHRIREENKLCELIIKIINKRVDITSAYKNWQEIGRALVNEFGESGRSYFHDLSRFHPEYEPRKTDRQYDYCLRRPGRYSAATIFHYSKEAGL